MQIKSKRSFWKKKKDESEENTTRVFVASVTVVTRGESTRNTILTMKITIMAKR